MNLTTPPLNKVTKPNHYNHNIIFFSWKPEFNKISGNLFHLLHNLLSFHAVLKNPLFITYHLLEMYLDESKVLRCFW